jgi:two-component sensor histidine kinase
MSPTHAASLVNMTGFVAGIVLYAMLLVMVLRARSSELDRRGRIDSLLVLTALLGLVWNTEAFVNYGLRDFGVAPMPLFAQAMAYAALGLLPAVVVHSVLRAGLAKLTSTATLVLIVAAYTLSVAAMAIHIASALRGAVVPAPAGLRLLTYGFVALVLPLAFATRGQPGARRALWMTALAVFALSALHLSEHERPERTWPAELIGHHSSLPIALSILYQEYPFTLADAFLKRALALLALMTAALLSYVTLAEFGTFNAGGAAANVAALVFLGVSLCAALLYPALVRASTWFVDSVVLRRVDYDQLRATIARRLNDVDTPEEALDVSCAVIGPALSATEIVWEDTERQTDTAGLAVVHVPSRGISADVVVPTTDQPRFSIAVRGLRGGRRLLSDDVAMLESVAQLVARRVDVLRMERERSERNIREEEIRRLASEAELRALRAQINPHFLFNALTTIGHLIEAAPDRALTTLLRLTELLRRVLRSDGRFSTLGAEISLVAAYLEVERARFEERLTVEIDVPTSLQAATIPPLMLQPLVENAIKHGIAPFRRRGHLILHAHLERLDARDSALVVTVQDSGPGLGSVDGDARRRAGVGLNNIEERLMRMYGEDASLRLSSTAGVGTTAELRVPFRRSSSEVLPSARRAPW